MLYAAFPPYVELDHYFIDILSETLLAGTLIVLGGKPSKGFIYYCIYFSDTTSLHFTFQWTPYKNWAWYKTTKEKNIFNALCVKLFY